MANDDKLIRAVQRSYKVGRSGLLIPWKDASSDVLSRERRVEFLCERLKSFTAFTLKRRIGNAVQCA